MHNPERSRKTIAGWASCAARLPEFFDRFTAPVLTIKSSAEEAKRAERASYLINLRKIRQRAPLTLLVTEDDHRARDLQKENTKEWGIGRRSLAIWRAIWKFREVRQNFPKRHDLWK